MTLGQARDGQCKGRVDRRKGQASQRSKLPVGRSEEHTSELQTLMRISYAVFCLLKKNRRYIALDTRNTLSSEEQTSALHPITRISHNAFCMKKKQNTHH